MACAIDATVGGASANSYATLAESNTYHANHPYSETWDGASDDEKCRALVTATRLLDYWFEWAGSPTDGVQNLLWPRLGCVAPSGLTQASDAIPARIRDAACEWARQLLDDDRTADSDVERQGLTSLKAGPIYLTFQAAVAKPVPDAVEVGVSWFGRKRSRGGGSIVLNRG